MTNVKSPVAAGRVLALLMLLLALALPGLARADSRLPEFLAKFQPADIVPGADRFGSLQGSPPTAAAYKGDQIVGRAYLNSDFVDAVGYSGKPIVILLGMDNEGTITGAKLVDHHEPIVLVGVPVAKVNHFIDGYIGMRLSDAPALRAKPPVDIVSGATVSVMVVGDSIIRSTLKAARSLGIGAAALAQTAPAKPAMIIETVAKPARDWTSLLGDGSIRRLTLTVGAINAAFAQSGNALAAAKPEPGPDDDAFIDLYVALVSVPTIGRSLLGEGEYGPLAASLKPGQQAILVAANGRYSFKGSGYVRGGIFDRIQIVQGEGSFRFHDRNHRRLGSLAVEGAPDLPEIAVFTIPDGASFDPTDEWRLQLLVQRAIGVLDKAFLTFDLGYTLPATYMSAAAVSAPAPLITATAEDAQMALWARVWNDGMPRIIIVALALALLTAMFFFQPWLVKRPVLLDRLRKGYLLFTLVWLGLYAHAQLSVVNVFTFLGALISGFRWEYFLMDPLVFILWSAVAASLLFWGRGAFCGWLCPFGALQEFANRLAKRLGLRQIALPWGLHERMWPAKYMIFLGLFGLSLYSLSSAEKLAEIEPFKTAIILHFAREWGFVLFAVALLAAGLFVERFFCRYLCPLGAALAIPGRMRTFDWLKRYDECGSPCQRCANECMVQAIHPEGHINPNECIYCMHCQELYNDDQKCPVMVKRRLKREKRQALAVPASDLPAVKPGETHEAR